MNEYQTKLFEDLMRLCEEREAFYFKDFEVDGYVFRIFNYRLASYSDFCEPGALECRGIMFRMDGDQPHSLAALPMEKFFNLNEVSSDINTLAENLVMLGRLSEDVFNYGKIVTMKEFDRVVEEQGLEALRDFFPFIGPFDLSKIVEAEVKSDGSLISTYMVGGKLFLKSKGSVSSDQALSAMGWLQSQPKLHHELVDMTQMGYTVNMEWVGPNNRVVLPYDDAELIVLAIRNRETGEYVERDQLFNLMMETEEIERRWSNKMVVKNWAHWIENVVPNETGIEGYVVRFEDGVRVKIKTPWYLALHHTKDSINSPRRLFEAVLEEATDDMKSMFYDDPQAIAMIEEMEVFVEEKYNHMVDTVERFYERNKHLERKEYAILGQQELEKMFFGLAMSKYTGKSVDYKAFLKSKWKQLGLKDREPEVE